MLKHISLCFVSVCFAGCATIAQPAQTSSKEASDKLFQQHAQQAIAKHDYRLLALSSRRLVITGLEQHDSEQLKTLCGVRFITKSKDVLKTTEDKQTRSKLYEYAAGYNNLLLEACLKVTSTSKASIE